MDAITEPAGGMMGPIHTLLSFNAHSEDFIRLKAELMFGEIVEIKAGHYTFFIARHYLKQEMPAIQQVINWENAKNQYMKA